MEPLNKSEIESLLSCNNVVFMLVAADWCRSCKEFLPLYHRLEKIYRTHVRFLVMDYDVNKAYLQSVGVEIVPSVLIYKQGTLVEMIQGTQSQEMYETLLTSQLVGF